MRVLVLNPASFITKNVVRDVIYGCWCKGKRIGGGTVPPYALLSVASVLKKNNVIVDFIDASAEQRSIKEIQGIIKGYDYVIISTSTMSINEDSEYLYHLKKVHPQLKTIVFGSHPTYMPESTLNKPSIDIIVQYEPEYIIRDLFQRWTEGKEWENLNGIGYKKDGKIIINSPYPFINNLDELPFLDVTFLSSKIHYFNPLIKQMPYITTTTQRGCPGQCIFCTAPSFYGNRFRVMSPQRIVAEMKYYKVNGFKEIYFRDETFVINKKHILELCERIKSEKLNLTWIANARVGMIDKELMEAMKGAGCHYIKIGVESGVQEILNKSKKGISINQTIQTFQWANEVGLNTHAHFMLGMPGETQLTMDETIKFSKKISPTTVTFGVCTPYPGTPLFETVKSIFPEIKDGADSDFKVLHTEGIFNQYYTQLNNKILKKYVRLAYRSFYCRPSYWLKTAFRIKAINDIKRFSIAGTKIFDFIIRGE